MMKSLTTNCMIAVAALAITVGSASAQVVKAEIPFTFRAGKTLMPPGSYEVNLGVSACRNFFIFRNAETHASVMLGNFNMGDVTKTWKGKALPTLGFDCVDAHCALRELWTADSSTAYYFPAPKVGRDADKQMTEIVMTRVKAD